jgi:hypothetical protein
MGTLSPVDLKGAERANTSHSRSGPGAGQDAAPELHEQPLAVKHHSGRVAVVLPGVSRVVLVKGGVDVLCWCGAKRLVVL